MRERLRLPLLLVVTSLLLTSVVVPGQAFAAPGLPSRRGDERVEVRIALPPIYVEAEVLLDLDGVRMVLTREVSPSVPSVTVALPNLSGTARLIVRAGRRHADRWREDDVDVSPAFALEASADLPASRVREVSTARPFGAGLAQPELWCSDAAPSRWPPAGLESNERRVGALPDEPPPLLGSELAVPSRDRLASQLALNPSGRPLASVVRPVVFPGASIPLRN